MQTINLVGIQDSMPARDSPGPSLNSNQCETEHVKCLEKNWCPTPPNMKPKCRSDECLELYQFRELFHKRAKDKMYRRMQRELQKEKDDNQILRKKVQELKQINQSLRKKVQELEQINQNLIKRIQQLEQALIGQKQ